MPVWLACWCVCAKFVPNLRQIRATGVDADQKIADLLLSLKLWKAVSAGGVIRRGMWPGGTPAPRWEVYPELNDPKHAASDHVALWVDLKL